MKFDAVPALIASFNERFRGPDILPLEISPVYDLARDWIPREPGGRIPFSESAGVYIFLDEAENVLYVGKASNNNTLGKRVCSYFRSTEPGKAAAILEDFGKVRFIRTIRVSESFFSAAVEEFLIQKLDPPLNRHGRLKQNEIASLGPV